MLRTQNPVRANEASGTCVACGAEAVQDRCDTCGVAQAPGGYRVERVLSRSAHGRVYLAHAPDGRRVALKELSCSLVPDTQTWDALEREARVLSELDHPQIPRFLTSFREGSGIHQRLYLAQQFIPGRTLAKVLQERAPSAHEVERIATQLLGIVKALHGRSPPLLHRDIKPANVILQGDGTVVLVDFGSARGLAKEVTHNATLVGTFGYMPPEQLGGTLTPRSDLYAVGATLLELLTRRPPSDFLRDGLELEGWESSVPEAWRPFLARLIARQPQDRFESAVKALEVLEAGLHRGPGSASASTETLELSTPWSIAEAKRKFTTRIAIGTLVILVGFSLGKRILSPPGDAGAAAAGPALVQGTPFDAALQTLAGDATEPQRLAALSAVRSGLGAASVAQLQRAEEVLTRLIGWESTTPVLTEATPLLGEVLERLPAVTDVSHATAALARRVLHPDPEVSGLARDALLKRAELDETTLALLRDALATNPGYDQGRAVIRILQKFDTSFTPEDALGALHSSHPLVVWNAFARLSSVESPSPALRHQVQALLKDPSERVQGSAEAILKAWSEHPRPR